MEINLNMVWLAGVVAFFLPLVTSAVKRAQWSRRTKQVVAIIMAAIAGVVMTGMQMSWVFGTAGEFLRLALFHVVDIWVVAAVAYDHFWEDTPVEENLTALGSDSRQDPEDIP